jgi:peptidyl-prolyl cis-trans isomerase B (cyclophilin B)
VAGKDRKKQLARQRYERQQQRRRAEEARARRIRIIGSVVAVAVIAGGGAGVVALVGNDDESNADTSPTPTPQAQASTPKVKPGECAYATGLAGAAKNVGTPPAKPAYDKTVKATVKTNQGDVKLELDGKKAPCTVNSFAYLTKKNFYDKTDCHRLTSGGLNVLQCGDPTGSGSGGPGYQFADENTEGAKYTKGTLAMANSGPNTNSSQFFMVYKDSELPPNYSVFGKITSGVDVLEKIAKAGSDPKGDGKPKKKVTIQDVTIAGN